MKDCIVVGGGPAGLTAALYLARFLRSVTVFDAGQGRAAMIPKAHNLGPFPAGIAGAELLDRMRSHAVHYGAEIEIGTVHTVKKMNEVFEVESDRGIETARRVIFASGVVNHRPPLPRHIHDQGVLRGLIRYCPVCDAHEVQGKRVAVLGSGTHGLDEASFVRHFSASVTLIPPDGTVAAPKDGLSGVVSPMNQLALSDLHVIVTLESGEIRQFDTLYVAMGTAPRSAVAAELGVLLNEGGTSMSTQTRKRASMGYMRLVT